MDNHSGTSVCKTDACFDTAPPSGYQMIAGLNSNILQMLVFDPEKNKFIAFVLKSIHFKSNYLDYYKQLHHFFEESNLAQHSYKDVVVLWETQRSTLVPDALFDPAGQELYFQFNQGALADEKVYSDKLKTTEAFNVYAIPSDLEKNISFKPFRIRHHASVFIESLMIFSKHSLLPKQVFINVHHGFFDMAVAEAGRLVFYNTFGYKTAGDFIYFVLFVFGQLKLSPESDGVILSGEIVKNSALYEVLYKYVRKVDFAAPGVQYANSHILNDIPAHTVHNLVNAVLCEL
ncbi:MAG TPA: DUF3822 family protein [Bacteroidales bacterium]|nr:DUF3822 family protein [Bacteroidales bacterium]HPS27151.1 DUF3822 family protein [Bacteroidales bacterium]